MRRKTNKNYYQKKKKAISKDVLTEDRIREIHRYFEDQKLSIQERQEKASRNVREWYEFSIRPRTEEEIRERVIHDIETGQNTCCLSYICTFSILSEEFIEELMELTKVTKSSTKGYGDKLDWTAICTKQKLSEEFIEKHANKVNWRVIYASQDLSDEFRRKHLKQLKEEYEKSEKDL